MEYTIKMLSKLANISTRTLRHYDNIGLLNPSYINDSGYRIYETLQVDLLQQIMMYKVLEMPLKEIGVIINSDDFDTLNSLRDHANKLNDKKIEIDKILNNIKKTIRSIERDTKMNNEEKFEGLKNEIIKENTIKYGEELIEKYGEDVIDQSYSKFKKLSKFEIQKQKELSDVIDDLLVKAVKSGDINNSVSRELCLKHQEWIKSYWPTYTTRAHFSLIEMYLKDERFKSYYDKRVLGGTQFLRDAMELYLKIK